MVSFVELVHKSSGFVLGTGYCNDVSPFVYLRHDIIQDRARKVLFSLLIISVKPLSSALKSNLYCWGGLGCVAWQERPLSKLSLSLARLSPPPWYVPFFRSREGRAFPYLAAVSLRSPERPETEAVDYVGSRALRPSFGASSILFWGTLTLSPVYASLGAMTWRPVTWRYDSAPIFA